MEKVNDDEALMNSNGGSNGHQYYNYWRNGSRNNYFDKVVKSYPPCYQFKPTDLELLWYYLRNKVLGLPLPMNRIMDINLYSYSPRQLSEKYELIREEEWYFFSQRKKKYPKGSRPDRAAGNGFWKATGANANILFGGGHLLGYKKTLVYYEGPSRCGSKTDWRMHEYRLDKHHTPTTSRVQTDDMMLDEWVLCKIYDQSKPPNDHNQEDEEPQFDETYNEELPNAENPGSNNYFDKVVKSYPPCYRFKPTDLELLWYYLRIKVLGLPLPMNRIMDINLYSYSPRQLSEKYELIREEEWYFFSQRKKKYPKGSRPDRAAGNGFWKATGADANILFSGGHLLGYKKTFVYYEGPYRCGAKTDWRMHEYRLDKHHTPTTSRVQTDDMMLDEWVLCKIYDQSKPPNDHNQEDEEPQFDETYNEELPNAENPGSNRQYPDNEGTQFVSYYEEPQLVGTHNEGLPNAENPGSNPQYLDIEGTQFVFYYEDLPNAINTRNIQPYQDNEGIQFEIQNEELQNEINPRNIQQYQGNKRMKIVNDNEGLQNAEPQREYINIQPYHDNEGIQVAIHNEELQNAENPGNIQQYQDNKRMKIVNDNEGLLQNAEPQPEYISSESPQLQPFPNQMNCNDYGAPDSTGSNNGCPYGTDQLHDNCYFSGYLRDVLPPDYFPHFDQI